MPKITVKDLDKFAQDLLELASHMNFLADHGIPQENPVYQQLTDETLQRNIEVTLTEEDNHRKSVGFVVWGNRLNIQSRDMPYIFSTQERAKYELDNFLGNHPYISVNDYTVKELFA